MEGPDPPGDHSLYRRERLRGLEWSWAGGFWEAEILATLRERGETIDHAPEAVLEYHGGGDLRRLLRERWVHARHFGSCRAGRGGRVARTVGAPAVPAVLLARIGRALRAAGEPSGPWMPALPWLLVLLGVWSIGEVAGTWLGPAGMTLPESTGGDMMRRPASGVGGTRCGERSA